MIPGSKTMGAMADDTHTRFVHTKDKSIGDIMLNMGSAANADNVGRHTCKCNQIQSMWQQKFGCRLPMADGHIFFTSDDYCGPCKNIFEVSSKCVPTSTNTQAIKSNNRLFDTAHVTPPGCLATKAQRLSSLVGTDSALMAL